MKRLHLPELYGWSAFQDRLDIDFNSVAWFSRGASVVVDPLPMSAHDLAHLKSLGPLGFIIITNSRHVRDAAALKAATGAKLVGPAGERDNFPLPCDRWLKDGDVLVPGLRALTVDGSKTPGELALVLDDRTLVCGDLVRSHRAGALQLLKPDQGLSDLARARASVARLAGLPVQAVLVGDGFSEYRDGQAAMRALSRVISA